MNSNLLIRLCVVALVVIVALLLWQQLMNLSDGMKLVGFLAIGGVLGLLAVKFLLPWIGDLMGEAVFSSGEEVVQDEMMKAAAKINQGDYHGAIQHYEKMLEDKPDDPFPVAEIAKLHAERLHDPHSALQVLSDHLQSKDWPVDDAAFIMFRIAEVYLTHLKDFASSRHMLEQVITNFPSTRHSANAHHKVGELEQAEYKYVMEQRAKAAAAASAEAATPEES